MLYGWIGFFIAVYKWNVYKHREYQALICTEHGNVPDIRYLTLRSTYINKKKKQKQLEWLNSTFFLNCFSTIYFWNTVALH